MDKRLTDFMTAADSVPPRLNERKLLTLSEARRQRRLLLAAFFASMLWAVAALLLLFMLWRVNAAAARNATLFILASISVAIVFADCVLYTQVKFNKKKEGVQ